MLPPSSQVPDLTSKMAGLHFAEMYPDYHGEKPQLVIREQPRHRHRFRYTSESGKHGCLLAKSYNKGSTPKIYPTVEILNYNGKVTLIRCSLVQNNNNADDHPHKLLKDDKVRDVNCIVPENGSYTVSFAGLGILYTPKNNVPQWLFNKLKSRYSEQYHEKLKDKCKNWAKDINLNIVRLKFSAHDLTTGEEICKPVFSEPIHYSKSADTNDLKIVRISPKTGKPSGGDAVLMFVEKVKKDNIEIRFYELDTSGREVWSGKGCFNLKDVHHQYGIKFKTPPYKNENTPVDVKVYIMLYRPSDRETSEPKEFTYKADVYKQQTMTIGGSISTLLPSPNSHTNKYVKRVHEVPFEMPPPQSQVLPGISSPVQQFCGLGSALAASSCQPQPQPTTLPQVYQATATIDPTTAAATTIQTATSMPNLEINSSEFDEFVRGQVHLNDEEILYFNPEVLVSHFGLDPRFIQSGEIVHADNVHVGASIVSSTLPSSRLVADGGRNSAMTILKRAINVILPGRFGKQFIQVGPAVVPGRLDQRASLSVDSVAYSSLTLKSQDKIRQTALNKQKRTINLKLPSRFGKQIKSAVVAGRLERRASLPDDWREPSSSKRKLALEEQPQFVNILHQLESTHISNVVL